MADEGGSALERYRAYLRLLARMNLAPRLQGKLDGGVKERVVKTS